MSNSETTPSSATPLRTYICQVCGYVYDEAKGDEEEGFAPGTLWKDIPPNWVCPDCAARKEEFEMIEV